MSDIQKLKLDLKVKKLKLIWILCIAALAGHAQDDVLKKTTDSLFNQGRIKYNNAKYEEALTDFSAIIQLDGSHKNAILQRGFCQVLLKNFSAAIADFSTVIASDPTHQWAYISRGGAYNKMNEYQKAIADFDEAIRLKPEDAEAYNNRGFSKKMLGDTKGACEDWSKSKKLGNEEAKIILKNNRCK